jgi:hypothetical protein
MHVIKRENVIGLGSRVVREKNIFLLKNTLKREKYTLLWINFRAKYTLICAHRKYLGSTEIVLHICMKQLVS